MDERVRNQVPKWIKQNYYNKIETPHFEVTEQEIEEFDKRQKKRRSDDAGDDVDEEIQW